MQAEALDPTDLAKLLREGIESRMDMDVYLEVLEEEEPQRDEILVQVGIWADG